LLVRRFSRFRLSARYFSWNMMKEMLAPGFYFFVLSLSGSLIWGIDNIVISGVMGVAFVSSFAIATRLTTVLRGLIAVPFSTSNPTITALNAERREHSAQRLFSLSMKLALTAAILFSVELLLFGRRFIALWAGHSVVVDRATFCALTAILVINILQLPAFAFLTATSRHRIYGRLSLIEGVANLGLSWWWAHCWGVFGVALGTLVPHALLSGGYLIITGMKMNRLTVSELWSGQITKLMLPAVATLSVGLLLKNFSSTWQQWTLSTGSTAAVFIVVTWITSTSQEERGLLATALRFDRSTV
jgi:O-antigen/teichoic acid export membrane protein